MRICHMCGERAARQAYFCSFKCQNDFQYHSFIGAWVFAYLGGGIGINAKGVSGHVRRFLKEMYSDGCALCGWCEMNPSTGRIPLEIDHIDGDSENNSVENLRMICPNCHSLTPSFRNLNRGKGRSWRRDKYVKVVQ